jgi:predicted component of type VI protein secretion system
MNVRLVVEQGARRRVVRITGPEAVLGRSHGNTVRIPSSEVSRQHCRLLLEDGLVTVEDLDSVNGTFLNGRRIRGAEYVRPGDQLEVGPVTFVVEYELTPDALARLRGQPVEADAGLLELLADGEAVDGDDLPMLQPADLDDLPVVEMVDQPGAVDTVMPVADDSAPLAADFEIDGTAWQMPDGGDLRDLLSQMEEDTPTTPHKPKRPR